MGKIEKEFSYTALTNKQVLKTGNISAVSEDDARKALEALGLSIRTLQEIKIGRENPFTPYFASVPVKTR